MIDIDDATRRQIISVGTAARRILSDADIVGALNEVREWTKEQLFLTEPWSPNTRETFYFQVLGIDNLTAALRQRVAIMDQLVHNEDQDTE